MLETSWEPQGINHASDFKGVQQQGQVYVADVNNYREKQSKYNTKLGELNEGNIKKLKKKIGFIGKTYGCLLSHKFKYVSFLSCF